MTKQLRGNQKCATQKTEERSNVPDKGNQLRSDCAFSQYIIDGYLKYVVSAIYKSHEASQSAAIRHAVNNYYQKQRILI